MNLQAEWLEVDGLGGYATGTVGGIRTRRYHGLLVPALTPPTGRFVLVNGFDAFVETDAGRFALSTQKYAPDVVAPDGVTRMLRWTSEPWPTWTFKLEDGTEIVHELFAVHGTPSVVLTWRLERATLARGKRGKSRRMLLTVRPFVSGRDHHALHAENPTFRFDADEKDAKSSDARAVRGARQPRRASDSRISWRPYEGLPAIESLANGTYRHDPHWYQRFLYEEEAARRYDATEDLGSPGEFVFDLAKGEAVWILNAGTAEADSLFEKKETAAARAKRLRRVETKRRAAFASPLERAADGYVVPRGEGKTIVAGYPWFSDWGRDTCIALRGLCIARGRIDDARAILIEWAGALADGLVPNRFPDRGETAEYNAIDAALWFVVAVEELLAAAKRSRQRVISAVSAADENALLAAVRAILEALVRGTRHGIRMDEDALLAAGEPGQQLTWMDARCEGREVTPRIGKPVEIQALWHSALVFAGKRLKDGPRWRSLAADAHDSFLERFWNERDNCLFDVIDVDHVRGQTDASFRPNQILTIGGLPRPLLVGPRARQVVDAVESRLVTPLGLRTLAPDDPRYQPRYDGTQPERDRAYHQGTAWPWLLGPFVEAWTRVRNDTATARREAHRRFLQPLLDRMVENGVPHLCEVTDAEPPHGWKGAPFQAWSLSELLRLEPRARLAKAKARTSSG